MPVQATMPLRIGETLTGKPSASIFSTTVWAVLVFDARNIERLHHRQADFAASELVSDVGDGVPLIAADAATSHGHAPRNSNPPATAGECRNDLRSRAHLSASFRRR